MKKFKIPFWLTILISMALGVIFALIAGEFGLIAFTKEWVAPLGTIFMRLLKFIAIPLILASLITGISNLTDISRLATIGLKTLGIYITTTIIALSIGLLVVNLISPSSFFPESEKETMQLQYAQQVDAASTQATAQGKDSPLHFLVEMVPENMFAAFSDNGNMLQVIFIAILLGVAMVMLKKQQVKPIKEFVSSANEIILKVIDIIMKFAPIGVFALMAGMITELVGTNPKGVFVLLQSLGVYMLTVVLGLVIMMLVVYPTIIILFTKVKLKDFYKTMLPVQLLAFSTSSSAATLPLNMETVNQELGIDNEIVSFVLPVGATINMDGTSLYQAVAAVFIAGVFGMELTFMQQLLIIFTGLLASIGSAAVPGAGIIMLIVVLSAIGVPETGIALIFALDRPLDMLRTAVNVTGDATVCSVIATQEDAFHNEPI